MTAVMRLQIFPGIQAPTNGNPGKTGIERGGSATNPDAGAGRRGTEGFNGCHHHSRLAADLQPPPPTSSPWRRRMRYQLNWGGGGSPSVIYTRTEGLIPSWMWLIDRISPTQGECTNKFNKVSRVCKHGLR